MPERSTLVALEEIDSAAALRGLEASIASVVRGKPDVIRLAVVAALARGHVLIEDVPGVGKTTLAQALARSLGVQFQRIQFTSDLLPSDIIGVSIWNQQRQQFQWNPGPLFANVVLADEINRASPKTQSALLEAMAEGRVTVEREQHTLPRPFLVLATQNPVEHHGTFPLPESQLDRFLMSISIGYLGREDERELLLMGGVEAVLGELGPALDGERLLRLQRAVPRVVVAPKLADYAIAIAESTRGDSRFAAGISTRGLQGLLRAAQASALCDGRDFVVPDDIARLIEPVLAHRLAMRRGAGHDAARLALREIVGRLPVPL